MSFHIYILRRRRLRKLHWDRIAHRNIPFEVTPWNELATQHEFISDVRDEDDGKIVGIIARPDVYTTEFGSDLYYGCLLERHPGERDDLFVAAEWTVDFDQETTHNTDPEGNINTDPDRLLALAFNLYKPEEKERIERKLQQQRFGIQQSFWFLLPNLIKRALKKPEDPKDELAQLGNYYSLDFRLDGKNLVLDENVVPGRMKSWGSRYYELKTSDGDIVAKIHRKAGPLGLSTTHIVDEYAIEIDNRYEHNKPLLYLAIALADYMHMEDRIRNNCFYEGKDKSRLPDLSKLFRYD